MTNFKVQLFDNKCLTLKTFEKDVTRPFVLVSDKLDGIRMHTSNIEKPEFLSRSNKPIQNKQLREKFAPLLKEAKKFNVIFDGEIYSPDLTFQEITYFVMTKDIESEKNIKKVKREIEKGEKTGPIAKWLSVPSSLRFYIFDTFVPDQPEMPLKRRLLDTEMVYDQAFTESSKGVSRIVEHTLIVREGIGAHYMDSLERGNEGLMVQNPMAPYKQGRISYKSGDGYKFKPYEEFDGEVIGVEQATVVDPNAEKKINELGRSVTSKKKGDRIPIEKSSGFHVRMEDGRELIVSLGCREKPITDSVKELYWEQRDELIGRWIRFKGLDYGSKNVPRHCHMLDFREDK